MTTIELKERLSDDEFIDDQPVKVWVKTETGQWILVNVCAVDSYNNRETMIILDRY